MKIEVIKPHKLTAEELHKRATKLLTGLQAKFSTDFKAEQVSPNLVTFKITGGMMRGTTGEVRLLPNEVKVAAELPAILVAMTGIVTKMTREELDKAIDGE